MVMYLHSIIMRIKILSNKFLKNENKISKLLHLINKKNDFSIMNNSIILDNIFIINK